MLQAPSGLGSSNISLSRPRAVGRRERLLVVLGEIVWYRHLNRLAFAVTYQQIAEFVGCGGKTAWQDVRALEQAGVLIFVDPGRRRARGLRGLPVMLGLVFPGETPSAVRQQTEKTVNFGTRRVQREAAEEARWQRRRAAKLQSKPPDLDDSKSKSLSP